jgi:hypothetical protein
VNSQSAAKPPRPAQPTSLDVPKKARSSIEHAAH